MKQTSSLNIIFAGTPEFSAVALNALLKTSHRIVAVYTQPDRPAGRGRELKTSAVKEIALKNTLPLYQPLTLRDAAEQQKLVHLQADLMIVVAYGLLLPTAVLRAATLGCINIHASLLPRWRGAAPIQRAILAGDTKTGVTIMQMDEGLDTGPLLLQRECEIHSSETSEQLHHRLAILGAEALLETLNHLSQIKSKPQNNALATYAQKISKEEAKLDWHLSADELERKVRAFNPWPIATFQLNETVVRVFEAKMIEKEGAPGKIIAATSAGIDIGTGKNSLRLMKLQLPGGRVLSAADILNGRSSDFVVGKIV